MGGSFFRKSSTHGGCHYEVYQLPVIRGDSLTFKKKFFAFMINRKYGQINLENCYFLKHLVSLFCQLKIGVCCCYMPLNFTIIISSVLEQPRPGSSRVFTSLDWSDAPTLLVGLRVFPRTWPVIYTFYKNSFSTPCSSV